MCDKAVTFSHASCTKDVTPVTSGEPLIERDSISEQRSCPSLRVSGVIFVETEARLILQGAVSSANAASLFSGQRALSSKAKKPPHLETPCPQRIFLSDEVFLLSSCVFAISSVPVVLQAEHEVLVLEPLNGSARHATALPNDGLYLGCKLIPEVLVVQAQLVKSHLKHVNNNLVL